MRPFPLLFDHPSFITDKGIDFHSQHQNVRRRNVYAATGHADKQDWVVSCKKTLRSSTAYADAVTYNYHKRRILFIYVLFHFFFQS